MNSIYMMSHSGARGSPTQMRQLAAMRGLMAKPSGEIIESPIISNFKEGLSVLEYFNSTHGARKGLADTALKTANSGYLTRRLVDVAQDSIITIAGLRLAARHQDAGDHRRRHRSSRRWRRAFSAAPRRSDLHDPDGKVIVAAGRMIVEEDMPAINAAGIQEVKIRSVLTCEAPNGVCGACYGRDLARGTPVNMGEAVGVIAAQSIGEPGTQLTMRTFHIGGAAQLADQSFIESNFDGEVKIRNRNLARNANGDLMAMARNVAVVIYDRTGAERAVHRVQYGARLKVDEGDKIKRGQRIAEWDPFTRPILTEIDGVVGFEDLTEGASMSEQVDEATGIAKRIVIDWRSSPRTASLKPAMVIKGKDGKIDQAAARRRRALPAAGRVDHLGRAGRARCSAGDVIARISVNSAKTRDITGGLPRVAELFEARRPKDHAIIAEISGTVQFGRDFKNKQRLTIVPSEDGAEPVEYLIPKAKHIHLQDGDVIEKGEYIVDGNPAPHDILAIKGVEELAAYLVNEIQEVYRLQGVSINDKHIEVIVRQMLQKVDIVDPGDTDFLQGRAGGQDRARDRRTRSCAAEGKKPASRRAGAARHHQGEPADALVHLGGVLPGDDPRPHRGGGQRQGRHARGSEGERHRRPSDPGRHGRRDDQAALDRLRCATRSSWPQKAEESQTPEALPLAAPGAEPVVRRERSKSAAE